MLSSFICIFCSSIKTLDYNKGKKHWGFVRSSLNGYINMNIQFDRVHLNHSRQLFLQLQQRTTKFWYLSKMFSWSLYQYFRYSQQVHFPSRCRTFFLHLFCHFLFFSRFSASSIKNTFLKKQELICRKKRQVIAFQNRLKINLSFLMLGAILETIE